MANRAFLHRIAQATRLRTVPLSLGSVLVVAADAAGRGASLEPLRVVACLFIAASLHVVAILVSDLHDHAAGTDKLARLDRNGIPTGPSPLEDGTLQPRQIAAAALVLTIDASIVTALVGRPEAMGWFAAALAAIWSYAGPPLRVAYVGAGFGELLIAACYGPMLAAATASAIGVPLTSSSLVASSIVGALVAMTFCSHHFLHWRADRQASKRTPAVVFGEDGGLLFVTVVDLAAYAAVGVGIVTGTLPAVSALALLGAPGISVALRKAQPDPIVQRILGLIGAHLAAVVFAVAGLCLGLALR